MIPPHASASPRVLITGATGFIGRELMVSARPFRLRAALRSGPVSGLSNESVVVGEIDGATDWKQALAGVDYVVHLAARVHVMNPGASDRIEFERTNVAGSENLAKAAAAAGVKRLIFMSSVKVNGEMTRDRPFRADDVPRPCDDYGRSKLEAERRLLRIDAESDLRVAIIRPPLVYGPGVGGNFLRLLSWAYRGAPLPLAAVKNMRSMVSVWNLCDLICSLLGLPEAVSGVFMVSDGEDISTPRLIGALAAGLGRPARLFKVPLAPLRILAKATGKSAEFQRLCGSLTVDIGPTRERLNWSPPVTLLHGLERTARWYLNERKTAGTLR